MNQSSYVILVSGRGSNMQALVEAGLPGRCVGVISNLPEAPGLAWAAARGLTPRVVDHRQYPSREAFDAALAAGVLVHGATGHFVSAELDAGPAIAQAALAVRPEDTAETLAARVLSLEHVLYPRAAALLLSGRVHLEAGRACFSGVAVPETALCTPGPTPDP